MDFEEKERLYEWADVVEELALLRNRQNEQGLGRLEQKEIERLGAKAHLAYHYMKLRKYMSADVIDKKLSQLGF